MKRCLVAAIAWLLLPSLALAASDKPLVIESGQVKQLPANTTVQTNASSTSAASINLPPGTAPTSPNAGDCWTTTTPQVTVSCFISGSPVTLYPASVAANPFPIGPGQIGVGAGSPPIATFCPNNAGEGSLCLRTDRGFAYSMWDPTTAVPAQVQTASAQSTFSVTLGVAPTTGDTLWAICHINGTAPTAGSGWTSYATHSPVGADPAFNLVYHIVEPGDGATQTPCSSAANTTSDVQIVEVSGVDMTNAPNSVQQLVVQANGSYATSTTVTAAFTSTSANTFAIAFASALRNTAPGIGSPGTAPTWNAGWSNTSSIGGLTTGNPAISVTSEQFSSSSSSISAQATQSPVGTNGMVVALLVLQPSTDPLTTGWQPVSYLTTVKSASSTITSMGRSLNFGTCMAATADADQNVTVTAAQNSGCVPSSALASTGVSASTYGDSTHVPQITVNAQGQLTSVSNVAISGGGGGSATIVAPQGRLTLVTGTPVMTSDQTAKSTVYYDCYAGKSVPYFDGSNDQIDAIGACEVSLTMQTSGTGVTNNAGVFDVWWVHGGASRICVATNGSGGGWASDTGGSNTARGTGYSQVHNTRGYWTNVNSISHCYNGSTDYGSVSADQATLLGSLFTTAAGQTSVQFHPTAASGGSNPIIGLGNAYNLKRVWSQSTDSHSGWTYGTNAWRECDNNANNRVSWVDSLGQSQAHGRLHMLSTNSSAGFNINWILALDTTSIGGSGVTLPSGTQDVGGMSAPASYASNLFSYDAEFSTPPVVGFHFYQCMEGSNGAGSYSMNGYGVFPVTVDVEMACPIVFLPAFRRRKRRAANDDMTRREAA